MHPASSTPRARRTRIRRRPARGAPAAGAHAGGRGAARPTAGAAGGAIRPIICSPIRCAGSRHRRRPGRCCEVDAAERATGHLRRSSAFAAARRARLGLPLFAIPERQMLGDHLPARSSSCRTRTTKGRWRPSRARISAGFSESAGAALFRRSGSLHAMSCGETGRSRPFVVPDCRQGVAEHPRPAARTLDRPWPASSPARTATCRARSGRSASWAPVCPGSWRYFLPSAVPGFGG